MSISDLSLCITDLNSSKLMLRKKSWNQLQQFLDDDKIIKILNKEKSNTCSWTNLLNSVHEFLCLEAKKLAEDELKGKKSMTNASYTQRNLLTAVVRKATHGHAQRLAGQKLLKCILKCFNSIELQKYFGDSYINILKDYFLTNSHYMGNVPPNYWTEILHHLKNLYNSSRNDTRILQCLQLTFQKGPFFGLPAKDTKQLFSFVTEVAHHQFEDCTKKLSLEITINMLLDFCTQTAKDSRLSCCKLGEEFIEKIINILETNTYENVKIIIYKFLLLQIKVHHPKGSSERNKCAYACDWRKWKTNLRYLYSAIVRKINNHVKRHNVELNYGEKQSQFHSLNKELLALGIEVYKQVCHVNFDSIPMTEMNCSFEPSAKRVKMDFSIYSIISNIQETKNWPWIEFISSVLEDCPTLITSYQYIMLLQTLSTLQAQCKDKNVQHHLYKCLCVLIKIQDQVNDLKDSHKDKLHSLWMVVWDVAHRTAGLNQNIIFTHKLIQSLIKLENKLPFVNLFNTYHSGVLLLNEHSLESLDVLCNRFTIPKNLLIDDAFQKYILRWILNTDNETCHVFSEKITAKVIISLILKVWPKSTTYFIEEKSVELSYFCDIEEVHCITYLQESLWTQKRQNDEADDYETKYFKKNDSLLEELIELIKEYSLQFLNDERNNEFEKILFPLINFIILITNILSELVEYEVIIENDLCEHRLTYKLNEMLNLLLVIIKKYKVNLKNPERNNINILKSFDKLFCIKAQETVLKSMFDLFPQEIIKILFENVNSVDEDENEDDRDSRSDFNALETCHQTLCNYFSNSHLPVLNNTQLKALESYLDYQYELELPQDYNLAIMVLESLTKCKIGAIPENALEKAYTCISKLCKIYYKNSESAITLLNLWYDLYPHTINSKSEEVKVGAAEILKPFFDCYSDYGPNVCISLINCMGQVIKWDMSFSWFNDDTCLAHNLLIFLKHEYQEVRIAAIKSLTILFNEHGTSVQNIQHQQETYFTIINRQVNEVFMVDETLLTDCNRKIDEEVSRTMAALLTFCTVIVSSTVCIKRALFSLLKLTYSRKIDSTYLKNALNLVSNFFNSNDVYSFLKPYADYLIFNWYKDGLDIQKFPYELLECKTVKEFNKNYLKDMGHVFLQHKQSDILNNISEHTGIAVNNIIKECLPNIIVNYLFSLITNTNVTCSEVYENIKEQFGSEIIINTVISDFHLMVANIIGCVHDEAYLRNEFSVISLLPEPNEPFYSLNVVLKTLNLLERKFLSSESCVSFCSKKIPSKLQKILLHMRTCVDVAPYTEDKIIEFFKFTVYVNILLDHLNEIEGLKEYIIKEVSYTLLHLINSNESGDSLKILVCKYFQKAIPKIITNNNKNLQDLLPSIIGTMMIHSTKGNETLSEECVKLLLIVIRQSQEDIKILDPLPGNVEKFKCLLPIYNKIEQRINKCPLKENIKDFLLISRESNICIQGIVQLRRQMSEKRMDLEDLYEQAQLLRGFSEDYEHNILHRLVYVLVRMCSLPNNDVNIEAARCLGELGPANLATVTLDIQKKYKDVFEPYNVYVAGCALSLLSQYLFDKDIKIVQATCNALYEILASKDGEKALVSDREFVNNGKINRGHFQPFVSIEKTKDLKCNINISSFKMAIDRDDLWYPTDVCFSEWILNLVCALINSFEKCYLQDLIPLCKVKIEFAQNMFPLLVVFILHFSKDICVDVLSSQIRNFFEKHWTASLKENHNKNDIVLNKDAIKCLLEVIHLVQLQKYNFNKKKQDQDFEVNYLHIANAAHYCSLYFSALQYIEFWSHKRLDEISKNQKVFQYSNDTPLYTIITNEELEIQKIAQNILKDSFNKIGDCNALSYITFNSEDAEIFEQMQKWDQVTLQYDIRMSHNDNSFNHLPDLTRALKKNSLMQIPLLCRNDQDQQYECAWRLNNWSISESDKMDEKTVLDFDKEHYSALKALHEKDDNSLDRYLNRARKILISELKKLNLVSCKSVYDILTRLRCLKELEDFEKNDLNKWKRKKETYLIDFEYFELIQAQRIVLLKNAISSGRNDLKGVHSHFNLKLAECARKEGYDNVSKRALCELKYIPDLDLVTKYQVTLEDVQLWWHKDKSTAMSKLRSLLNATSEYPRLHSDALKLYGTWMMESNSVGSEYLLKSIAALQKIDYNHENLFEIYDILGRHCDFKYQQVVAYTKSSEFEQKIKNMKKCRLAVSLIQNKSNRGITQDERKTIALYQRQSDIDDNEIQSTYKEKENFLDMALRYYIQNLEKSKSNDLRMFRLLSLWLENRNSDIINRLTSELLLTIPSYKYIPILPQLVPHLNPKEDNNFNTLVFQIIERCAKDHPYHTIPLILALANANQDKIYQQGEKKRDTGSLRIKAAQKLIEELKNSSVSSLVTKMELVSAALIELAYLDAESCRNVGKTFRIKSSCHIRRIKNFEDVMVPTYKLPISRSNHYSNIIGIVSFSDDFTNVGGINAPKRLSCVCTDGITRHMLVKGKDDLRQDAVMQQVFDIMNEFLASNKKTFKQRLRIRTYKVVPLSQRSGVLHWVENSLPLGSYLTGDGNKQGAHHRYNRNDYTVSKCRNDIAAAAKSKLSNADKLKTFLNICEHFHPIFYKFFEEYFPEPSTWYERKQAYTHSVATTSMCGYILGIGDRHVQNILINEETAEVVHIDFGIAFEQGKVLPTPETVPFRLTRDIVSGMGICGIEGVFRKSCENTMEVLRNNSETIVTILEVLLYDPLYAWSVTPSQAYSRQFNKDIEGEQSHGSNSSTTKESSPGSDDCLSLNILAERALWRLRQKLKGTEEGSATSVEGQVEKLILQATDPANLSRLFYGWQAYL